MYYILFIKLESRTVYGTGILYDTSHKLSLLKNLVKLNAAFHHGVYRAIKVLLFKHCCGLHSNNGSFSLPSYGIVTEVLELLIVRSMVVI